MQIQTYDTSVAITLHGLGSLKHHRLQQRFIDGSIVLM